jgi:hypothetical protein
MSPYCMLMITEQELQESVMITTIYSYCTMTESASVDISEISI